MPHIQEIKFVDSIFRYFEYLIIIGGTFGFVHYHVCSIFTLFIFYGAIGLLGYHAGILLSLVGVSNKLIKFVLVVLLTLFNAYFINSLLTALSVL